MIKKIELNKVTSFKKLETLETDKKVNLIYGLNGTGKTTLSDYFYNKEEPRFSNCNIVGLNNEKILVYNQKFIKDVFYEQDDLAGIFTLSKENKDAETKIKQANDEKLRLTETKNTKIAKINTLEIDIENKKEEAKNKIWDIKNIADRNLILNFCIKNLNTKKKLFEHCIDLEKTKEKPVKNIEDLKNEAEALKGENAQRYDDAIPTITFSEHEIEENLLFQEEIVGNENSTLAELIQKLENSDWVKEGIDYLPKEMTSTAEPCPFCQEKTITQSFIDNIKNFFNETYTNNLKQLEDLLSNYKTSIKSIRSKAEYENNPFIANEKLEFQNLYNGALEILKDNQRAIERKVKNPSQKIQLKNSKEAIDKLNEFIKEKDQKRKEHNSKIDNKAQALEQIKNNFWEIMRWDYDQTIASYQQNEKDDKNKIEAISNETEKLNEKINKQTGIIKTQEQSTINIQEAIDNINKMLNDFGIADFTIKKYEGDFYRLIREGNDEKIFSTLSEGEKMIISFLYFIELCKGKTSDTDTGQKKIVVIDDPISSLSHIYIFNIAELIKREFTKGEALKADKYEQIFILTHSLYFFYELVDRNEHKKKPKEEDKKQKLFRMTKNTEGSQILKMEYSEIQNDYQSYWQIIKDDNSQCQAVIANCMRNIIEYFFGFIEKKNLNNVSQKIELKDNKYQAFFRYINRESHSEQQNISDTSEFDYNAFKEAFRLVFEKNGYEEHYNKMMQ